MTDFERAKQDAIYRVQKMNQNYRQKIEGEKIEMKKEVENQSGALDIMKLIRFDSVKTDPDRLLLLGVLLLLSTEKTDEKLLYALLYIMI
jgi:hypothetical protein